MTSNSSARRAGSSSLGTSSSSSTGGSPSRASTLRQLGQLERQHQRAQLPLRRVAARGRAGEADLEVVGVRSEAGEAAALVERRAAPPGRRPGGRAPRPRLAACVHVGIAACSASRHGQLAVQRAEVLAEQRRQRGDQRAPPHHDARARARQLLVVGRRAGARRRGPRLSSAFRLLSTFWNALRLVVVAALDVEDGEVEEAPPASEGAARGSSRSSGTNSTTLTRAKGGRRAPDHLAVEPRDPPGRPQLDLEPALEPAGGRSPRAAAPTPRRIRAAGSDPRRATSGTSAAPPGSRRPRGRWSCPGRCRREGPSAARAGTSVSGSRLRQPSARSSRMRIGCDAPEQRCAQSRIGMTTQT